MVSSWDLTEDHHLTSIGNLKAQVLQTWRNRGCTSCTAENKMDSSQWLTQGVLPRNLTSIYTSLNLMTSFCCMKYESRSCM